MPGSTRKATNISLDPDLLGQARELEVNVSRAAEDGVRLAVKKAREARWLAENAEAIESSNRWVEEHGLPLAKYRQF